MNEKSVVENESRGIANQANRAFDQREALDGDVANFDGATDLSQIGYEALQAAHASKANLFRQLVNAAGTKFDAASYDDSRGDSDWSETAATGVETQTSFEQKVETIRAALVQQYEQYGVTPEDFTLVETQNEDGQAAHTLVYSRANGIDLGDPAKDYDEKRSYDSIMLDDESHITEINGEKVDTRTGMTESTYKAMIEQARQNNQALPDSQRTKDNVVWTETWLTGEPADADDARFAAVDYVDDDGQVSLYCRSRDGVSRDIRFRPAVVIA